MGHDDRAPAAGSGIARRRAVVKTMIGKTSFYRTIGDVVLAIVVDFM